MIIEPKSPPPRGHNGGPPIEEVRNPFGPNGWVAIGRDSRFHPIVGFGKSVPPCDPTKGSYSRAEAWLDLIMECRYSSGQVYNGGRVMTIERGQLVGATSWLANRWNWTPKTVRHFLETIQEAEMIEKMSPGTEKAHEQGTAAGDDKGSSDTGQQRGKQKGKQSQLLTICNYGVYQLSWMFKGQANGQAEGQEKGEQGASKGQARGNIYKEEQGNKGTREQVDIESARRELDAVAEEAERIRVRLLNDNRDTLPSEITAPGLMQTTAIIAWLRSGVVAELDIIPTIKADAARIKARGTQKIRSWDYFNQSVADAKDRRERGLPVPTQFNGIANGRAPTVPAADRWAKIVADKKL